ncbi:MAG: DUF1956 domain-containing protein [Alphaproteobacteria bacterium]|nr:DUF1956 domain-containing protein [Alphaproteobacteria bacterium]
MAATEAFGRLGFEAASTRAIAEAAGANLAAIPYHFGGKEGLYLAVADAIAAGMLERMGPVLGAIEAGFNAAQDRATTLAMVQTLVEGLAFTMMRPETAAWARFILREQAEPTEAFTRLYEGPMKRMLTALCGLLGRFAGRDPAKSEIKLTAMTLLGQVIAFRAAHAAVLATMGWTEIGPGEMQEVRAVLQANVAAIAQALERKAP